MSPLPAIPLETVSALDMVRRHPHRALAMAKAATETFGPASRLAARLLAPALDRASRDWMAWHGNPYLAEMDEMAAILGIAGVYALNTCFEWGCTSGVWPSPDGPRLRRVLDWPFPRLGESTVLAWQEPYRYFNIGWPGFVGVINGLAPGRFACAINQAPMRRHGHGLVGDWLANRIAVKGCRALPPAHLLRRVFETAPDYAAAKVMLRDTEIAVPAIFVVSGTQDGEGCVIERTERDSHVHEMGGAAACVANHFEGIKGGWRPRPVDSHGRAACARGLPEEAPDFAWFVPPIANLNTRLVFETTARDGALALMGTRGAVATTQVLRVNAWAARPG